MHYPEKSLQATQVWSPGTCISSISGSVVPTSRTAPPPLARGWLGGGAEGKSTVCGLDAPYLFPLCLLITD
jgi:hypothetical protein